MPEESKLKPQHNFELMYMNGSNMMGTHWINTDYDLLDVYKSYLLSGKGFMVWENGVIDCSKIIGIIKK